MSFLKIFLKTINELAQIVCNLGDIIVDNKND
jgi:hypothetical protein